MVNINRCPHHYYFFKYVGKSCDIAPPFNTFLTKIFSLKSEYKIVIEILKVFFYYQIFRNGCMMHLHFDTVIMQFNIYNFHVKHNT